jgi:quercetin dioxygenase-like cupin family protein
MSVMTQRVAGESLGLWLARDIDRLKRDLEGARDRAARTLVKDDQLSVVLVGVRAGGEIREHVAEGSITIHVLEGCIDLDVDGANRSLGAGMLMFLAGGIPHSVFSSEGGIFLLTIANGSPAR